MAKINLTTIESLDRSFEQFAQKTMANRRPYKNHVIAQLQNYQI